MGTVLVAKIHLPTVCGELMKTSSRFNSRRKSVYRAWIAASLVLAVSALSANSAPAQLIRAPLNDGFMRTSSIDVTVDEMLGPQKPRLDAEPILGPGYPSLWIAEIQYKRFRHRLMKVTDPVTKQVNDELVWYLVYRIIPRDYTELAGEKRDDLRAKLENAELQPSNSIDQELVQPLILPRFVLRIDDVLNGPEQLDEVNLEIQRAVLQREFEKRGSKLKLLNSVTAIQEVPEPVSHNDPLIDPLENAMYGVAIWRNVDPDTDYCTVFMKGFSNAYRIVDAGGQSVVQEKVVEQRFGRQGDRFRQQESEFRFMDVARLYSNGKVNVTFEGVVSSFSPARRPPAFVFTLREEFLEKSEKEVQWPRWVYRDRDADLTVPDMESVLRQATTSASDEINP